MEARITAFNSDLSKMIELTGSNLKKMIEEGFTNERSLTSKQVSKTTDEIMNLIT